MEKADDGHTWQDSEISRTVFSCTKLAKFGNQSSYASLTVKINYTSMLLLTKTSTSFGTQSR